MARSISDLMRSGAVSTKAANAILAQTKPGVPAKMARFNGRRKDEAGVRDRGHLKSGELNSVADKQTSSSPIASPPTSRKGAKQRRGQPKAAHIDREQGPTFPAGGYASGSPGTKSGNTRMKGPVRRAGGIGTQYGGPARRMPEGG
jgi:hypothetical protein